MRLRDQPGHDDDDDDDDDENEAEVKGTVAGAVVGHACPFTFTVGTTTVITTEGTTFKDTTCAKVVNGVTVEAKGTRTGPTTITATRVEKK